MLGHTVTIGHAIGKRMFDGGDGPENWKIPSWAFLIGLADLVVFAPIFLILFYTLHNIFPTLAIIEDTNPPAYEPVALDEGATDQGPAGPIPGKPITSSLRATRRLLCSVAGWRSYFRGIVCSVVYAVVEGTLSNIFQLYLPLIPIGSLLAMLAMCQLGAAWTHIVISVPDNRPFYKRLPPFKQTFEATCFPILFAWLAVALSFAVPALIGKAMHLPIGMPGKPHGGGANEIWDLWESWKILFVAFISLLLNLFTVIPACVVLIRVQASFLPPDEDTIVPFDRTFQGKHEPSIVGGKGFVSIRDALATFPKESWIRLYKLIGKIFGVTVAVYMLLFVVLIPEAILILSHSKRTDGQFHTM